VLLKLRDRGLAECSHVIGTLNDRRPASHPAACRGACFPRPAPNCAGGGPRPAIEMQALRDHPDCAGRRSRARRSGRSRPPCQLTFDPARTSPRPIIRRASVRHRHPARTGRQRSDRNGGGLPCGRLRLRRCPYERPASPGRRPWRDFRGLVACGGFSYGDVLGAGEGWAKSILFNTRAREQFAAFSRGHDTASRWASATAARCSPICMRTDSRRRPLAAFRAQPLRAVRGAHPDAPRSPRRLRYCSRTWPVRGCRSRSRTARGARSSATRRIWPPRSHS
jgi:hypothetical protein